MSCLHLYDLLRQVPTHSMTFVGRARHFGRRDRTCDVGAADPRADMGTDLAWSAAVNRGSRRVPGFRAFRARLRESGRARISAQIHCRRAARMCHDRAPRVRTDTSQLCPSLQAALHFLRPDGARVVMLASDSSRCPTPDRGSPSATMQRSTRRWLVVEVHEPVFETLLARRQGVRRVCR